MASSGKKKTTMAKMTRENKIRERRMEKQAKKDARKLAAEDRGDASATELGGTHWTETGPSTLEALQALPPLPADE